MNKRGQSMIEYTLIAVLVILGIVIMGPYVLRSVNAHFKLWDEAVQDSFTENLTQAPVSEIPNITLNCACETTKGGCGSSQAGSQCGANQRIYNHSCNPQLCDGAPASSCVDDPTCCTDWVGIGCGNLPCSAPACPTTPATYTPPSGTNNCYYGYQIQAKACGTNNATQCGLCNSNDSSGCVPGTTTLCSMPACLGIVSPGAQPCTNEPPVSGPLLQNNGITYVQAGNCNPNATCQYYCDTAKGYSLNATGTGCSITPPYITRFIVSDCRQPTSLCPSGYNQVSAWHVGDTDPCKDQYYNDNVTPNSGRGWVALCVLSSLPSPPPLTRFIISDCGQATRPCPGGYTPVSSWHTGSNCSQQFYNDDAGFRTAGWAALCVPSSLPSPPLTRFIISDCGQATRSCPSGYNPVSAWHVGPGGACSLLYYGDNTGINYKAGWVALCDPNS